MTIHSSTLRTLFLATAMTLATWPVLAASSGDSGGSAPSAGGPTTPSPKKLMCKKGYVVKTVTLRSVKKRKCVKAVVGVLPDDQLYQQGNALALEGEYDWALQVLALVQNQQQPDVLNMQGYSHRKSGRVEIAIGYYQKALGLNPDFVRAREYLGEGYVSAGRIDLARLQLAEIKTRCGETCEEFKELSQSISKASN